jgi:hypothetical protein
MNPFDVLQVVQQDYLTYVRTFQRFQNPEIQAWVLERVHSGTLLWKPPFIQISRPFAPGDRLEDMVAEGLLHPAAPPIFRRDPGDPASAPVHPYRHQSETIRRILGADSPSPMSGEGAGGEGLCPLEQFYKDSLATGIKVGEDLRGQVRQAIETLGNGFLYGELITLFTGKGDPGASRETSNVKREDDATFHALRFTPHASQLPCANDVEGGLNDLAARLEVG